MSIRVLLADDQALVRGGLRKIVDGEPDMQVVAEAADGLEAVEAARARSPTSRWSTSACRGSTGSRRRAGSWQASAPACAC